MFDQLNSRAKAICDSLSRMPDQLDIRSSTTTAGSTLLDFGTDRTGTLAAGVELTRVCMSGLADVSIAPPHAQTPWPRMTVITDHPLHACIASQYAGWPFSTEDYFAMCSGPVRLAKGGEAILADYALTSDEQTVVGVFEASRLPSENDLAEFADQCQRKPSEVTICVAKTSSLPGTLQVVGRSVETAMHKLFEIGFDLTRVVRAIGWAPIPPLADDDYQSMGWANDAILYGAEVHLWLSNADDIYSLADRLPSCTSADHGRPFLEIFEENNRDFYRVDRMLFSPAKTSLNCLKTGRSVTTGALRFDLLKASFDWKND